MAEIINFESAADWNSLQDYEDASPADQKILSDYIESRIIDFNAERRLREVDRKLGQTALAATLSEQALAA